MRSYALKSWTETLEEAFTVEIRVFHALEEGSTIGRFGVWLYNQIQRYAPFVHNVYWFIAEGFGLINKWGLLYGGKMFRNELRQFKPQLIISMHDNLNLGYFEDARKELGAGRVRCVTYCGEWFGGFGFSPNWINRSVDQFIVRHEGVREFALQKGLRDSQVSVFRNLLHPRDYEPRLDEAAQNELRESLGLRDDRFTVYLATGGLGADRHLNFLRLLNEVLANRVQVIAVCGRNEHALLRLNEWKTEHPDFGLWVEGYSDRVHHFLQLSDCVVSRGGANTMAEAIHFQCPVIFHACGGIMPQERCTLRFLEQFGVGKRISAPRDLVGLIHEWVSQPSVYAQIKASFLPLRDESHPTELVRALIRLGETVEIGAADGEEA